MISEREGIAQYIQSDRQVPQSTRKVGNGENKCFYNFTGEITVTLACMDAEDIRTHTCILYTPRKCA